MGLTTRNDDLLPTYLPADGAAPSHGVGLGASRATWRRMEPVDHGHSAAKRARQQFRGFALDASSGAIQWHDRLLILTEDECQLLRLLVKHAGRILSLAEISQALDERQEIVEQRLHTLCVALRSQGVSCLPRQARGLGFILWR